MNKAILMGRLTRDPEIRYTTTSNTMVASFTLAVDRRYQANNANGQTANQPTADFFNIVAWGKQAEFVSKYFKKGMQMLLSGRIQNRTWDDAQGQRHYITEIIAEEINFTGTKRENDQFRGEESFGASAGSFANNNSSSGNISNPFANVSSGGSIGSLDDDANSSSANQGDSSESSNDDFIVGDGSDELPF